MNTHIKIIEIEERIKKITEEIDENNQKQDIREQFEKFKNENNLMNYINDLVKEINFYENKTIEIKLRIGE